LARDANIASNPVAAENYLQHAEHYFRLIAAAQAGQRQVHNSDVRATGHAAQKTWTIVTISVASPIVSSPQGSNCAKPSPTKPTWLLRLLCNCTGNDSPGFGVKSRRQSPVTKATRIDIGAIFVTDTQATMSLLGRHEQQL
jgi:hypothetical protein